METQSQLKNRKIISHFLRQLSFNNRTWMKFVKFTLGYLVIYHYVLSEIHKEAIPLVGEISGAKVFSTI